MNTMNTNHNPYEASKRMPVGTRLTIDGIEGEIVRGYGCNQCSLSVNTCNFCCSGNKRPDKTDVVFFSDSDKMKERHKEDANSRRYEDEEEYEAQIS